MFFNSTFLEIFLPLLSLVYESVYGGDLLFLFIVYLFLLIKLLFLGVWGVYFQHPSRGFGFILEMAHFQGEFAWFGHP